MNTNQFKAAAVQMCSREDVGANLEACRKLTEQAARDGAQLVVLPECFAFLGKSERDKFAHAEALDGEPGPILAALQAIARTDGVWLIAGGMPERLPDEPEGAVSRTYNTAVVLSPEGELRETYRKIHRFDVDIPGGATLRESDTTAAGSELVVSETPLGRVGLSICYDVRFPELYRDLVVRKAAQVIVVPAAFTAHTGKAHWHTLLRARAVENQCFLIAAAQWGKHNDKRESYGHSMIIDPWGTVLAEWPEGDGVCVADIDLAVLDETRRRMPCLEHQALIR
jgi:deaminated glutathione amidase